MDQTNEEQKAQLEKFIAERAAYLRKQQAHLYEQGKTLGFTDPQLRFIIEAATFMAEVVNLTPSGLKVPPDPNIEIRTQ